MKNILILRRSPMSPVMMKMMTMLVAVQKVPIAEARKRKKTAKRKRLVQ